MIFILRVRPKIEFVILNGIGPLKFYPLPPSPLTALYQTQPTGPLNKGGKLGASPPPNLLVRIVKAYMGKLIYDKSQSRTPPPPPVYSGPYLE